MSFWDKLFGRDEAPVNPGPPPRHESPGRLSPDEEAIARYRYMLRTAPPEDIERAHAEAFAQLTSEQRQTVLAELSDRVPDYERPRSDDPRDLARAATRAEVREPGFMERSFGGYPRPGLGGFGGAGMGMAGGLLSGLAGAFIGSAIANQFFGNPFHAHNFAAENNLAPDQGFLGGAGDYAYADVPTVETPTGADYNQDPLGDPAYDFSNDYGQDPLGDPGDVGGDFGGDF